MKEIVAFPDSFSFRACAFLSFFSLSSSETSTGSGSGTFPGLLSSFLGSVSTAAGLFLSGDPPLDAVGISTSCSESLVQIIGVLLNILQHLHKIGLLEETPGAGVTRQLDPHLRPERLPERARARPSPRMPRAPGPGGLRIGEPGLEGLVVGVYLEALPVGRDGLAVVEEAHMSRAEAREALSPVGLELDSLLRVGKGIGEFSEGSVGRGSVGVENVVADCVGEVADGAVVVAGGEGGVASGLSFVGHTRMKLGDLIGSWELGMNENRPFSQVIPENLEPAISLREKNASLSLGTVDTIPLQPSNYLSIVESSSSRQEFVHNQSSPGEAIQQQNPHTVVTPILAAMDCTNTEIMQTDPQYPHKELALAVKDSNLAPQEDSVSKLKTWKRAGNKEGRLQRKQMTGKELSQLQGLKRGRQDPTSNGHLWVKDLTYTDTDQWDEAKIRELVEAEDCQAILDIQSLNPHTMDKWCWKMGVKGKFSVASSYNFEFYDSQLAV
ncbi:elongation factor 1-alpha 1 [Striga asiatica]|uniref:Elongation factor 1-alpha 1 n=1 Tax=Striga asiatica TaxID=4170 RepID=A0A5A7PD76_STRAF|nr:elongation factor 1-alpha 1 [Striga asiatica]